MQQNKNKDNNEVQCNNYFMSVFNLHGDTRNVEEEIIYLQNILHDYFKVQYEIIKTLILRLNIR